MPHLRLFTVGALFFILALACGGDPKQVVLPSDLKNLDQSPELVKQLQELPGEERELLAGYIARRELGKALGAPAALPVTVGQAIEEQRAFVAELKQQEAEAEALAQQMRAKKEAAVRAMNEAVLVGLVSFDMLAEDFRQGRYSPQFRFDLALENKAQKAIAGLQGTVTFLDVLDNEVKSLNFVYDEGIAPGERKVWQGVSDFNQFMPEDKRLASMEKDKVRMRFVPSAIVFEDGMKLTAP